MRRPFVVLLAVACGVVSGESAREAARAQERSGASPPWPFGLDEAKPPGKRLRSDWYNLGILGAKARDADLEPVVAVTDGTPTRVARLADPESADSGPARLRVEVLYPAGPAEKAGLRVGDVIVGVGDVFFGLGSLEFLSRAIVEAESGADRGVKLLVERAGEKDLVPVVVTVPSGGKEAATPLAGKAREALIASASKWLAKRQDADGGFADTLSGTSGDVVQTSLAGLAWLAEGSDLAKGPRKENVRRAAAFVGAHAGVEDPKPSDSAENSSHANWALAYGAIFLGELHARTPSKEVHAALLRIGAALAENQEDSGGWAHGPGGPNSLGYVELNIVAGVALAGLGLARRAGYEVPAETLAKCEEYLLASSGSDGGVGYSAKTNHRGDGNIGRTAGTWLGCVTLGMGGTPWGRRLEGYVRAKSGTIYGGHASLLQHQQLTGVAAQALGGEAAKAYWAVCERDLVLARAPDGSFQPRPWHESVAAGMNTDALFGEVWTTATWAVVLACEPVEGGRPGLPAWTGRLPAPARKK